MYLLDQHMPGILRDMGLATLKEASALPQILSALDVAAKALPFLTLAALFLSYRVSLGVFLRKDV